jgi:hypothetical protein
MNHYHSFWMPLYAALTPMNGRINKDVRLSFFAAKRRKY